ncbi:MAG TPA: hypothetical protein VMY35_18910 [Phycisphaerae bacterium]|nr:hypothetical protein [Phycisphaerae bacterium]
MAGVNNIVVLGFGSWATAYKLPTLGFGIGVLPTTLSPTIRRAARTADGRLGRAAETVPDPIRRGPATTSTVVRRAPG